MLPKSDRLFSTNKEWSLEAIKNSLDIFFLCDLFFKPLNQHSALLFMGDYLSYLESHSSLPFLFPI